MRQLGRQPCRQGDMQAGIHAGRARAKPGNQLVIIK